MSLIQVSFPSIPDISVVWLDGGYIWESKGILEVLQSEGDPSSLLPSSSSTKLEIPVVKIGKHNSHIFMLEEPDELIAAIDRAA